MADELRPLFEAIDRYIDLTDKALDDTQFDEDVLRQHNDAQDALYWQMKALVPTNDDGEFPWEQDR